MDSKDQSSKFICPITGKIMVDPFIDADGNSFEGPTILEWIDRYGVSPVTGQKMLRTEVQPNVLLKQQISVWAESTAATQDDSPKKKLLKLMKYPIKMVKGTKKSSALVLPDYDAILRFRKLHPPSSYRQERDLEQKDERDMEDIHRPIGIVKAIESRANLERARAGLQAKRDSSGDSYIEIPLESSDALEDKDTHRASTDHGGTGDKKTLKSRRKKKSYDEYDDGPPDEESVAFERSKAHAPQLLHTSRALEERIKFLSSAEHIIEIDDEDDQDQTEPWYCVLNPWRNTIDMLYQDDDGPTGEDIRSLDGLIALCFLWVLTVSIQTVLSLYVKGFSTWLQEPTSFTGMLNSSQFSSAYTAAFVILGYLVPRTFVGSMINSNKHTWFAVPTSQQFLGFLLSCFLRVGPSLYVVVVVAVVYGRISSETVIRTVLYETCSRNWYTNLPFINNLSIFWLGESAVYSKLGIGDDDGFGGSLELYGDFDTCFPSLWAVSCAAQMVLISVPIMFAFSVHAYKGMACAIIWVVLAFTARTLIAIETTSAYAFVQMVYYNPLTRGDAFALGMLVYMTRQAAFMPAALRKPVVAAKGGSFKTSVVSTAPSSFAMSTGYSSVSYNAARKSGSANGCAAYCLAPLYDTVGGLRSTKSAALHSGEFWDDRGGGKYGRGGEETETDPLLASTSDSQQKSKKKKKKKKRSSSRPRPDQGSEFLEAMENGLKSTGRGSDSGEKIDPSELKRKGGRSSRRHVHFMAPDDVDDIRSERSGSSMETDDSVDSLASICLKTASALLAVGLVVGSIFWLCYGSPSWFPSQLSDRQFQNVTMLVAALSTSAVLYLVVEGSIWPLQMVLSSPVWHPLVSISYTGYILQFLIVCVFAARLPGPNATWYGSWLDYVLIYCQILAANFIAAFSLSVLVERPCIALATRFFAVSQR